MQANGIQEVRGSTPLGSTTLLFSVGYGDSAVPTDTLNTSAVMASPLDAFLAEKHADGRSPHTLYMYAYTCKCVRSWTTDGLRAHFIDLRSRVAPTTVYTHYRHISVFNRWREKNGHGSAELPDIKEPKTVIRPVSEDTMRVVLQSMEGFATFEECRNYALILTLFDTGLRLSECLGLERLDLREDVFYVSGKTGQRIVPYGRKTARSLERYLSVRDDRNPWMWVSKEGKRLGKSGAQTVFRRLRKRLGLRKFHPHLLRHSFACAFLEGSDDIKAVKDLLGHSNIRMTERYLHNNPERLRRQHQKHSPGDRI